MITGYQAGDSGSDFQYNSGPLMTQNGREGTFGICTGAGKFIGMADAGRLDFDENFSGLRSFQIDFYDFQWFASFECNCRTSFHIRFSKVISHHNRSVAIAIGLVFEVTCQSNWQRSGHPVVRP